MRNPAVAGLFYSGRAEDLAEEVDSALSGASQETLPIVGAVVPHAGYM
jgi:AmmeMemoRadiSam system protein B